MAKLERGDVRVKLIRELALGEKTQAQLAEVYGCTRQAVHAFVQRHAADIARARERIDDEFVSVELASKVARVAILNDQVLQAVELLSDPDNALRAGVGRAEMERIIQSGTRAIADELGQIPQRVQMEIGGKFDVTINGVDLSALK